jgi:hypothetical protein
MEVETEKSSYTLNHNGEELDESKTESYEVLDEDAPAETDKMLEKIIKKSTEVLAEADESTALAEKSEAVKEPEIAEVPIKNRILQFFERKKKIDLPTEAANGNGSAVDGKTETEPDAEPAPKRRFIPIRLHNPFAKKSENGDAPPAPAEPAPTNEASSSDETKGEKIESCCHIEFEF